MYTEWNKHLPNLIAQSSCEPSTAYTVLWRIELEQMTLSWSDRDAWSPSVSVRPGEQAAFIRTQTRCSNLLN